MKKKEWFVMAVTAFAVAALLMPRNAQTEYETAVVSVRTVEETIEASGVIAPRETFLAAPLTAGKLRLLVEKGEEVAEGQALFEVENAPADAMTKMQELLEEGEEEAISTVQLYKANTVLSPLSGCVQELYASNAQAVSLGTPVLLLRSQEQVLQFSVSQSKRESLYVGQKVRASRRDREYTGTIEDISLEESGQYLVTASLVGANSLSAGMQMDVSVLLRSVTAPCVPLEALDGDQLYCVMEDGLAKVQVKTSLCDAMYMALTMGPPVGTEVALGEVS